MRFALSIKNWMAAALMIAVPAVPHAAPRCPDIVKLRDDLIKKLEDAAAAPDFVPPQILKSKWYGADGKPVPYKSGFKIVDGEVVSKYRPKQLIPRTTKEAEVGEVFAEGHLLTNLTDMQAFFNSSHYADGTQVFLFLRGPTGKQELMINDRISVKVPGHFVSHRGLANEYKRLTGREPMVEAGGEVTVSADRYINAIVDQIGTFNFGDVFRPSTDYSIDMLQAAGLKLHDHSQIKRFVKTDKTTHDANHAKALLAAQHDLLLSQTYPDFVKTAENLGARYLAMMRPHMTNEPLLKEISKKLHYNFVKNRAEPVRAEAYDIIRSVLFGMKEGHRNAAWSLYEIIDKDARRRMNPSREFELINEFQNRYFDDLASVVKEVTERSH